MAWRCSLYLGGAGNLKIGVFSVIKGRTSDFYRCGKRRGIALQSGEHDIEWNLIPLDEVGHSGFKLRPRCILEFGGRPSYRHGMALNTLVLYQHEYDIVIVMDADFVVMRQNWDSLIVDVMKDKDVLATMDTEWPVVRPFLMVFRKGILTAEIDFRPVSFDLGQKSLFGMDTGCRIIGHIVRNNLRCEVLRGKRNSKFKKTNSISYFYGGEIFGSHMGGARNIDYKSDYVTQWRKWMKANTVYKQEESNGDG